MARALELAARGRATTHPNPRVGCVVVRDGKIVAEGFHERAGGAHAEVMALQAAGRKAKGADVYVTLEPCCHFGRTGPCTDVLFEAGVRRVIAAMPDPNPRVAGKGLAALHEFGIQTESGLMQEPAQALNRGFVSRMARGRPWVTLKLAMSLDGRTAMASGESRWITGAAARADVHRLRAEAGAALTSVNTVLADDPELTARLYSPPPCGEGLGEGVRRRRYASPQPGGGGAVRQPDRIVLDSRLRSPLTAKVWKAGARRIAVTTLAEDQAEALLNAGIEVVTAGAGAAQVDLAAALKALGRMEVNEVLVECGPRLAGALLQAKLVDELVIYTAPSLLGSEARALAHLPGIGALKDRLQLRFTDTRMLGADLRITAVPVTPAEAGVQ